MGVDSGVGLSHCTFPGLCEIVYGTVQRQEGKDFAFIRRDKDDVFVPAGHPAKARTMAACLHACK